jgi:hypothetical protein
MSEKNGMNGKVPRNPRPASHSPPSRAPQDEATPAAANGSASMADDASTGLLGALAPPSSPDPNGRDELGRFGPGNTLSRGHAGHRKVSEMRRAALAAETPDRVATVIGKLYDLAAEGDVPAAKVYLETVIGKSVQGVEISGPDGSPLERSAELSAALGAALSPFSEEVRFAVLGTIKRAVHAGLDAE